MMGKRNPMICMLWGLVVGLAVSLGGSMLLGYLISGETVDLEQGTTFAHAVRCAAAFLAAATTVALCRERPGLWGLLAAAALGVTLCLINLAFGEGFSGLLPGLLTLGLGAGAAVALLGSRKGRHGKVAKKIKFR